MAAGVDDPVTKALAEAIRYRVLMEAGVTDEADRCLDTYEAVATDLGQPFLRWSAAYLRSGRCFVAGELARAEAHAVAAHELGEATGQPDATAFFAQQLGPIRLEQGRPEEARGTAVGSGHHQPGPGAVRLPPRPPLMPEQGRLEESGHHFASVARADFSTVPTNQLWLTTMCNSAVAATCLGDGARAGVLRGLLKPYAGQVAGLPIMYIGAVTHLSGLRPAPWSISTRPRSTSPTPSTAPRASELRCSSRPHPVLGLGPGPCSAAAPPAMPSVAGSGSGAGRRFRHQAGLLRASGSGSARGPPEPDPGGFSPLVTT